MVYGDQNVAADMYFFIFRFLILFSYDYYFLMDTVFWKNHKALKLEI